jgi:tetratricopeptide (TPR) repeat protein
VSADSLDARENVIQQLTQSTGLDVRVVRGNATPEKNLAASIVEAFDSDKNIGGRPVVVVSDLDELVMDNPRVLVRLNEQRNEFIRATDGAVVVVAGSKLVDSLRRTAPDTWSVRAADLDLNTRPSTEARKGNRSPIRRGDAGERRELEEALERATAPARRGLILHRLAEVVESQAGSPQAVADLYLKAAEHHDGPWQRVLARTHAGRALSAAGDHERAEEILREAMEEAADVDDGLKAGALLNLAWARGASDLKSALAIADEAVALAVRSGQLELAAESRLTRAQLLQVSEKQLQRAFTEIAVAEDEAARAGSRHMLRETRLLRGILAAKLGFSRQNRFAWGRFLEEDSSSSALRDLCEIVQLLDEEGEPHSAELAFKNLLTLTARRSALDKLAHGIYLFLEDRFVSRGERIAVAPWIERLRGFLRGPELARYEGDLARLGIC